MFISSAEYSCLGGLPEKMWEDLPGVKGKKVFIKPNLVTPITSWDKHSCTDVRVVELIIKKLQREGCNRILVGDCGFKGQWKNTIESSSYSFLSSKYGIRLIGLQEGPNFHKFTLKRKDGYLSLFGAKFSDFMLGCDLVINVPKMKVHKMAIITGAIKNMMGTMAQKGSMHPRANSEILHKRLCDLYFLTKDIVKFIIVDGIVGSEYSEQCGVPVNSKIILSCTDQWDADVAMSKLMGINPNQVPYLEYIRCKYNGNKQFDNIKVPEDLIKNYEFSLRSRKCQF